MKKLAMAFGIALLFLIVAAAVYVYAPGGGQTDTGVLTGKVTVGPLTPVERVGVTPPVPNAEVFTSRKLLLYEADGKTLIEEIPIEAAGYYGTYDVTLKPGTYVLGYPRQGVGGARGLPAKVTIEAGRTTTLDVDIDTGIR
ncbi:MAG: hypothetical protein WBZ29_17900 [Methanocella sp.]